MRTPRPNGAWLILGLALAGLVATIGSTASAFRSQADSEKNSVVAAPDFRAPTVIASALGKSQGGATGFVKKGGAYFLYANVSDAGNPPSGVASVAADLSAITAGAGSVALSSGSFTVGGQSYNFRSAQQTAGVALAEGAAPYSLTTADNASNTGSAGGSSSVDNTPPTAADVQTANAGGGIAGRAEQGDTVSFTYSEPVEPDSILPGWNGGSTGVVVRITTGVALIGGLLGQNEGLQVFNSANTALLPLGAIDLKQQYVANTGLVLPGTMTFGATGAPSTMTISGGVVTIVLGTRAGNSALTVSAPAAMSWAPTTTPYDRAANSVSGATATESGPSDVEF